MTRRRRTAKEWERQYDEAVERFKHMSRSEQQAWCDVLVERLKAEGLPHEHVTVESLLNEYGGTRQ